MVSVKIRDTYFKFLFPYHFLEYKVSSPVNCDPPNRLYGGRGSNVNTLRSNGPICTSEDDQRSVGSKFLFNLKITNS